MYSDYTDNYEQESNFRICSSCRSRIYKDHMILSDEVYCPDCVERLTIDDIIRLCEFSDVHQLLCELGF